MKVYTYVYIYIYICVYIYLYIYIYVYFFVCTHDLRALTLGGRRRELKVYCFACGNPRPKPQEALTEIPQDRGRDFGRKAPKDDTIPAPKAYADTRRPCIRPRTQFGNPSTSIESPLPFRAGGQAPPFHRVKMSRHAEFFAARSNIYIYIYIHMYINTHIYICIL